MSRVLCVSAPRRATRGHLKNGECSQFFIQFNKEEGIQTPWDEKYPYQRVEIAKLKDGTIIGGVRHQFRNVEQRIETVTCVEFPALCPNSIVKDYQVHLAVEWSGWIQWAIDHQNLLENS